MLIISCIVIALSLGCVYGYWVHAHYRLTTITNHKVYQSAAMPPRRLIRFLKARGITTVFDFRAKDDADAVAKERAALIAAGLQHIHIPSGKKPKPECIQTFITAMHQELSAGHRVLLHCRDGEGRALFYSAVYRIEFENWQPEAAFHASIRLPRCLRLLNRLVPRLGRMSRRNDKTGLILNYQRQTAKA